MQTTKNTNKDAATTLTMVEDDGDDDEANDGG